MCSASRRFIFMYQRILQAKRERTKPRTTSYSPAMEYSRRGLSARIFSITASLKSSRFFNPCAS